MCCFIDNIVGDGSYDALESFEGSSQDYFKGARFHVVGGHVGL